MVGHLFQLGQWRIWPQHLLPRVSLDILFWISQNIIKKLNKTGTQNALCFVTRATIVKYKLMQTTAPQRTPVSPDTNENQGRWYGNDRTDH